MHNYLRHCASSYERQLCQLYGKTGGHKAYAILRERIDAEVVAIIRRLQGRE